jgi:hypothetical protein
MESGAARTDGADAQALARAMKFLRSKGFADAAAALEGRNDTVEVRAPAMSSLGRGYISRCVPSHQTKPRFAINSRSC